MVQFNAANYNEIAILLADSKETIIALSAALKKAGEKEALQEAIIQEQAATLKKTGEKVALQEAIIQEQAEALQKTLSTIKNLEQRLALLQKSMYGQKSERYIDNGTPLLPGLILPEPEEGSETAGTARVSDHERKKPQPHRAAGWNSFPDHLPREEVIIDLPEDEKKGLQFIGYEISERLLRRSEYIVLRIQRAKYAFPDRPGLGVTAPEPMPNVLSENSDRARYDLSVVVHLISEKFINHLPFYRQSESLRRQGICISRSQMGNWMMNVGELLKPLYRQLVTLVMSSPVVHADETSVRMLDKGKCRRCYIWVRKTGTGPPLTVYHFAASRNQATALELMGNYLGTYVSDACSAYDLLPGTRSACWAHARRKFFEVPTLNAPERLEAVSLIRLMYMNERMATDAAAEKTAETALIKARRAIRKNTRQHVDSYFRLCETIMTSGRAPSDPLVKAANYSLKQKKELQVFLSNPQVGMDNNPAENAIRPWALGRKNWLFVGNDHGGEMAAVITSMVNTCKDNKVNFAAWLLDILPKLATTRQSDINTLLPHLWKPKQD